MSDYSIYTDPQLLALLGDGDEAAFGEIFRRYRERLLYYLRKHTKSYEIAEEIVTDIFMKLWTGRELAAKIVDLAAFLHKVGYYKALDFLRTASRHERLQQVYFQYFQDVEERGADDLMIDAQDRQLLYQAINQLPPQRQTIYRMSRQEGLTHAEIAEALGLSPSTVNNQLVAATRSIAEFLRANGEVPAVVTLFFITG